MAIYARPRGGAAALGILWKNLPRRWARPGGSEVDDVSEWALGEAIHSLPRDRKAGLPAFTASWTNLAAASNEIGTTLGSSEDTAAIIVSDMRVDLPPRAPRGALCGTVAFPTGSGEVPSLFGRCLAEPWAGKLPTHLAVGAVAIASPVSEKQTRPLFVVTLARNDRYVDAVDRSIEGELREWDALALSFVEHHPTIDCAELDACGYRRQRDVVERGAATEGERACSFLSMGSSREHVLRCAIRVLPHTTALLGAVLDGATPAADGAEVALGETGARAVVDHRFALGRLRPGTRHASGVRLAYRWMLMSDASSRLTDWLGNVGADDQDYKSLFLTIATEIEKTLRGSPPVCNTSWRILYAR